MSHATVVAQPPDLTGAPAASPEGVLAELRRVQRALAEREQQIALVEELAGLGSWEIDLATDAVRWSREQERIHGVDAGGAPPTHTAFLAFVHPEDRGIIDAGMAELLRGEPLTVEYRIVRPDGAVRQLQARARVVVDETGRPARVVGTSLDVTERRRAEQELRSREASYRTIFQHASDAMWLDDLETGARLEVNDAAVAMFGYSAEEQKAVPPAALSAGEPPYSPAEARAYLARAAAGEPQRFEWRGRHRDGHPVWGEVRLTRVRVDGTERILAAMRDITDRKRVEAALHEAYAALEQRVAERTAALEASNAALVREAAEHARARETLQQRETLFQRLVENSSDFVMIVDDTAAITYVGPSCTEVLGHTPEEMLGNRPDALVHPDDVPQVMRDFAWIVEHPGESYTSIFRIRHRDGHYVVLEGRGRTLAPDSAREGIIAFGRDVTAREQAEADLRRQRAYFEDILNSIDAGVAVFDADGRHEYVSPAAMPDPAVRRWVIGTTLAEYAERRGLPPQVVAPRARSIAEAIRTRTPNEFEQEIVRPDGSVRVMLRRLLPVLDEAGAVARLIGYSVDITDRKRAEEALQGATADAERARAEAERARHEAERAREEAERANLAKSDFLSRMSHELRTPMNSILGFAQLLGRGELGAAQARSVQHILKAGRHLLHLINEVLEIARIEAGREDFSLEPVALAPLLQEALGLVRPLAQQHHVELREGAGPAEAFVHADRQRLVQVLLNLLSNAIKYNRPGGHVHLGCERAGGDGAWVIRVEDAGHGIPPARVAELFTPFARLGAEQTEVEGTGLGLALSKRLCEAMGGALALERSGSSGSVFRVTLRGAEGVGVGVGGATATPTSTPAAPSGGGEAARAATLLYVEDNLANVALLESILAARPEWRLVPALRGELGVALAREHRPDLVLLDLHLPDIPGEEVLRRLRADGRTARVPVVVVSADATAAALERLQGAGADAYLTKPLDVDELLATVARFLAGAP